MESKLSVAADAESLRKIYINPIGVLTPFLPSHFRVVEQEEKVMHKRISIANMAFRMVFFEN
jgi:hypothetical protein